MTAMQDLAVKTRTGLDKKRVRAETFVTDAKAKISGLHACLANPQAAWQLLSESYEVAVAENANKPVVLAAAFVPTTNLVIMGTLQGDLCLYDCENNQCYAKNLHNGAVRSVAINSCGNYAVIAAQKKAMIIEIGIPGTDRFFISKEEFEHPAMVRSVAYSPDGQSIATGCADGKVRLFERGQTECQKILTHDHHDEKPYHVREVAFFSSDTIVSVCGNQTVKLWDAKTGGCKEMLGELSIDKSLTAAALHAINKQAFFGFLHEPSTQMQLKKSEVTETEFEVLNQTNVRCFGFNRDFLITGSSKKVRPDDTKSPLLYETTIFGEILQSQEGANKLRKVMKPFITLGGFVSPLDVVAMSPRAEYLLCADSDPISLKGHLTVSSFVPCARLMDFEQAQFVVGFLDKADINKTIRLSNPHDKKLYAGLPERVKKTLAMHKYLVLEE